MLSAWIRSATAGVLVICTLLTVSPADSAEPIHLEYARALEAGEVLDLTEDNAPNYHYFGVAYPDDAGGEEYGPGYDALEMD